jgi:hypothetical protein
MLITFRLDMLFILRCVGNRLIGGFRYEYPGPSPKVPSIVLTLGDGSGGGSSGSSGNSC